MKNKFVKCVIIFFVLQFFAISTAFCMEEIEKSAIIKTIRLPNPDHQLHIYSDEAYKKLVTPFNKLLSFSSISYKPFPMDSETIRALMFAPIISQGTAGVIDLESFKGKLVVSPNIVDCVVACAKNKRFLYSAHLDDDSTPIALQEFHTFRKKYGFRPDNTVITLVSSHMSPKLKTIYENFTDFSEIKIDIGYSYMDITKQNTYVSESLVSPKEEANPMALLNKDLNIYSPRSIIMNPITDEFFRINAEQPSEDSEVILQLMNRAREKK